MKRRNVEGDHTFAKYVAERYNMFDLGGLLLDDKWNFTAAVEAFELEHLEIGGSISELLASNGYARSVYMGAVFAKNLGVPFFIIAHIENAKNIRIYQVQPDCADNKLQCVKDITLSEMEFIQWWQEKKGTVQTKPYRDDFQRRAEASYFDNLLESHGLKWGGNIDGYIMTLSNDVYNIDAIIENRFTNKKALSEYDPNVYYKSNGGDYHTWLPLIKLKERLGIPLFLMTYSNRDGEQDYVGITQILGQTENGLLYIKDKSGEVIRPCDNIVQDLPEIEKYIIRDRD